MPPIPSSTDLEAYLLKIPIVGNSSTGKTSLLLRYTDDHFSDQFIATVGVDFRMKTLEIAGCTVKLQLWDNAGQDRFRNIVSTFYRHADGLVVVFDVTDMSSFQSVGDWLGEARRGQAKEDCLVLLVGNKCDLTAQRLVDHEAAQELAHRLGVMYAEVSAKNGTNLNELFTSLARTLVERERLLRLSSLATPPPSKHVVDLTSERPNIGSCWGSNTCNLL